MDIHDNGVDSKESSGEGTDVVEKSPLYEHPALKRNDLVRLMLQALQDLGYSKSIQVLEEESQISLELAAVTSFRQAVLRGDWNTVNSLLPELQILSEDNMKKVKFLVGRQKFLELLEQQKATEALLCLRQELTPLNQERQKLHQLSSLMMCIDPEELKVQAKWDGAAKTSRSLLLNDLRKYISPNLLLPNARLAALLTQAIEFQKHNCLYHNTTDDAICLFEDHICDRSQIPRETKKVLFQHNDEVWYLQFSHNGKYLASASKDKTAIIWDLQNELVPPRHILSGHAKDVSLVSWSPDDSMILTCSQETVKLWNTETGECKLSISKHTAGIMSCSWFPDGKHFLTGGTDKHIFMLDLEGNEIRKWTVGIVQDMVLTSRGNRMIIAEEKKIRIINIEDNTEQCIPESDAIVSLTLSRDDRFLVVAVYDVPDIHVWDLERRELTNKYRGHKQSRFVIHTSFGGANEAFILSGSEDAKVYLWHRYNGTLLETFTGHTSTVNAVCWNPVNCSQFASASDDHTIRIWGPAVTHTSPQTHIPSVHLINVASSNGSIS